MEQCNIPRWQLIKGMHNNLSLEDFVQGYQKDKNALCLDVRTKQEYDFWHLPDAINFDYLSKTLADDLEKLPENKTYYIYCRTSRRSLRVCQLMRNMGFKEIYHLDDGVKDHIQEKA